MCLSFRPQTDTLAPIIIFPRLRGGVGWIGSSINIINIKAPIIIKCAMRGAEQRTPFPK